MTTTAAALTRTAWTALGGDAGAVDGVAFTGEGGLISAYPVTDVASAAMAAAALGIAEFVAARGEKFPRVTVDRRFASMWLLHSIRPIGWKMPPTWGPIAGDYPTRDGWIKLHTNWPHHQAAACRVLGTEPVRESVARAVATWGKTELESAVLAAGGCAAEFRSAADWAAHPQGKAVAAEPLVHIAMAGEGPRLAFAPARPLAGLRVLDCTRVLAGPIATRFLAGFGAQVLRIDPPDRDEPGLVAETTLGKRCAQLDLRKRADRAIFETLLAHADVFVHGYRPGALDGLGFDAARRAGLAPGLVDVCLDAYGWSGPWATRRGFDSLVQMSSGIAHTGMRWRKADKPVSLPAQALDHVTGYLMAAATLRGLARRLASGRGSQSRLSLARTAKFLNDALGEPATVPLEPETEADLAPGIEARSWGPARRLAPPVAIAGAPMRWDLPARALGPDPARWDAP